MKMTLLQMAQSIMNDMDSDAVTSISDNPEVGQVVSIIRDVYFQLISNIDLPELQQLINMTTVGFSAPNYLKLPDNVQDIFFLTYDKIRVGDPDKAPAFVKYMTAMEFVSLCNKRKSSQTNIITVNDPTSGVGLLIENDLPPEYWTSFDDTYIAFDKYDAAIDPNGVQGSKTITWGTIVPPWTVADSFIPTLGDNLFPLLLSEAKSTCLATIKQQVNPKIEKQARFQRIFTSNDRNRFESSEKARFNSQAAGPSFGRRSPGFGSGYYSQSPAAR